MYWRLNRMKEEKMQDIPIEKVAEELNNIDKARKKFCAYYTNKEFGSASSYDLCLCASSIGIEKCIDIICNAAK